MIHKRRYLSWARLTDISPARQCLRMAMRALAAAMSSQFRSHGEELYLKAKQLAEDLDASDLGLPWTDTEINIEQTQAWLLLAHYELFSPVENRLPTTVRRGFRLVHLSGLYRTDSADLCALGDFSSTKGSLSSFSDFVAVEERRRTFWVAFCLDRFLSAGEGSLPTIHDEIVCLCLFPAFMACTDHYRYP